MSQPSTNGSLLRKMISSFLLLALLAFLLSLYFLKYVPGQRSDFHRRAFLELSEIEKSFKQKNAAYMDVVTNSIQKMSDSELAKSLLLTGHFRYDTIAIPTPLRQTPNSPIVANNSRINKSAPSILSDVTFQQIDFLGGWQLAYLIRKKTRDSIRVTRVSTNVDTILRPIVSTYKDIFDDYLLILDTSVNINSPKSSRQNDYDHRGRVIFNSGLLSVDFLVDMDTLLKKTDGFSLLNIHDVKIEGNPYKLFLYPVELGNQRVILAGLISLPRYQEGSETVPIDLITVGGILVLLLLLNLPLLKIYIIGPLERITGLDIRMIITTYFLGAFVIFILFFLLFQSGVQSVSDKRDLNHIGDHIQHNFYSEISDMCRQAGHYDTLYAALHLKQNKKQIDMLLAGKPEIKMADPLRKYLIKNATTKYPDSLLAVLESLDKPIEENANDSVLNYFLHPYIYPQIDNVVWIDSPGIWKARWGFKKSFRKTYRLNVSDRQYYKDAINNKFLSLPDSFPVNYEFTIQPTLSRVSGDYNINVILKSRYKSLVGMDNKKQLLDQPGPVMVAVSSEMHSVSNTILPPGYCFSIVDNEGNILFDSKQGRPLLSNIFTEAGDNTDIRQCVRYRYKWLFDQFTLRGRQVALLSRPLPNLPYTLLVYYNTSINQEFQFHAMALSSFCLGCILLILAIIAFINEWGKTRPGFLSIPQINFNWLRPIPSKMTYYKHLRVGMFLLFGIYLLVWLVIEWVIPATEPSLLIISMSFPFFVAIHYYLLREKYYAFCKGRSDQFYTGLRSMPSFITLSFLILLLLIYALVDGLDWPQKIAYLVAQALLGLSVIRSAAWFKLEENHSVPETKPSEKPLTKTKGLIPRYTRAIIMGISMITLVPAISFFVLFYKEESNTQFKMEKLNMARSIQNRRHSVIDKKIPGYRFESQDASFLYNARFSNGIYFPDTSPIDTIPPGGEPYTLFPGYANLHNFLFATDSTTLELPGKEDVSGDSSWYFYTDKKTSTLSLYSKDQSPIKSTGILGDNANIHLPINRETQDSALTLFFRRVASTGAMVIFLVALAIGIILLTVYNLTVSLAKHIFLPDLLAKYQGFSKQHRLPHAVISALSGSHWPDQPESSSECGASNKEEGTEEAILLLQVDQAKVYDTIWNSLTTEEKYILYDFALDGFTNYKAGVILFKLLEKGFLIITDDYHLKVRTKSFHNYLVNKDIFNKQFLDKADNDVYKYMRNARKQGSWQAFRIPLNVLLAVTGLFIFLTQDALYQKVIGLFTSVPSLLQMVSSVFEKKGQNGNTPTPDDSAS